MGTGLMTAFLLDTNVLLRLVSTPDKIAASVRDTLADPTNELIVSAASAWEIAIKTRIGRLDGAPLLSAWDETLASMRAASLHSHPVIDLLALPLFLLINVFIGALFLATLRLLLLGRLFMK